MFLVYLRRELLNRKRQTLVVALGLGLAVALVVVVNALSAGVDDAQAQVLDSLYGIGTDISVTRTAQPGQGGGPQRFEVDGAAAGGEQRQFSRSQVQVNRGARTFTDADLATVGSVPGVSGLTTALRLSSITFDGELPDFSQLPQGGLGGGQGGGPGGQGGGQGGQGGGLGGGRGGGNANFSVATVGLMGVDVSRPDRGPLSATKVTGGRALGADDASSDVVVADATYAASESLTVGSTVTLAERPFTVVGLVASSTEAAETVTDLYLPLAVAQDLAQRPGEVTNLYIGTTSGDRTDAVAAALQQALPDATVNTSSQLGEAVSGSLSTASGLISNLGRWLSIIVLAAAFLGAILFTTSGVARRTREFGTLRAIGWSKGRIVGQVAGESTVQGLLGGLVGTVVGLVGARVASAVAPTLEASAATGNGFPGGAGGAGRFGGGTTASSLPGAVGRAGAGPLGGGQGGAGQLGGGQFGGGQFGAAATRTFEVALHAVVTPTVVVAAIALALAGGLLAGAFGGLRASRLKPADALRSVA